MTIIGLLEREYERALLLIGRVRERKVADATSATAAPLGQLASLLEQHTRISGALLCNALDVFGESRAAVAKLRRDHTRAPPLARLRLLTDKELAVAPLDLPAGNRVEGGWAEGLTVRKL